MEKRGEKVGSHLFFMDGILDRNKKLGLGRYELHFSVGC